MSAMRFRQTPRVKPSNDSQVDEMLANPTEYFAKVRAESRVEARKYVAQRERSTRGKHAARTA